MVCSKSGNPPLPCSPIFLPYTLWAGQWASALALGIIYTYNQYYPGNGSLWYIATLCGLFLLYTLGRAIKQSLYSKRWGLFLLNVFCIILCLWGGYFRAESIIIDYHKTHVFYNRAQGEYIIRVTQAPILVTLDGKPSWKVEGTLLGLYSTDKSKDFLRAPSTPIRLYLEEYKEPIQYGQYIQVKGKVTERHVPRQWGTIDKQGAMITNGREVTLYKGTYKVLPHTWYTSPSAYERITSHVQHVVKHIRTAVENILSKHLPPQWVPLSFTLLLGGSYEHIDPSIMKDFSFTGLIHILSISGSHIALLFSFVYGIGYVLGIPKRRVVYIGACIVFGYCLLVGADGPVLRATIMGLLMALSLLQGRSYVAVQGLNLCALAMLLYSPLLITTISFQLSFGATYGLILCGTHLYRRLPNWPVWIKGPLVLCLAAQLTVLPLQLYYFHYLSFISLLAAIIVAPVLDIAILLLMIGVVLPFIPFIWSGITWCLSWTVWITHILTTLPYGYIWIGAPPLVLGAVYYLWFLVFTWYLLQLKARTWYIPLCIAMGLLIGGTVWHYHRCLVIYPIPLGKGMAVYVKEPYGAGTLVTNQIPSLEDSIMQYKMQVATTAYGYPVSLVQWKTTDGSESTIFWKDNTMTCMMVNRQRGKKRLQLIDSSYKYIVCDDPRVAQQFANTHTDVVLYGKSTGDIDPEDPRIHCFAYEYVEPYVRR